MKRFGDDVALALMAVVLLVSVAFLVLPIVVALLMSFDARNYLGGFPPPGYSIKWYLSFFSDDYYLQGLKTSVILATLTAMVSTAIGVATALVLRRPGFPGKEALAAFFMSPLVVPGVVVGFALLLFFSIVGIYDGFVRLVGGHIIITIPYTIRTTLAGLVGIRPSLVEAAMSLGASERAAFWDITFPLAKTGIVAGAVFAFTFSLDDVAVSLFLTDPTSYTLPVALVSQMRSQFDLTIAAAATLLVIFTLAVIYLLDRIVGLDKIVGEGIYRG